MITNLINQIEMNKSIIRNIDINKKLNEKKLIKKD